MRKITQFITVLFLAMLIGFPAVSNAAYKDMWAQVYSWDGDVTADGRMELTEISEGITFVVMMADSVATVETLYYYNNNAMTSLANPVTGTNFESSSVCNDKVAFRVDPTETGDAQVDLIVVDQAGGYTAFVEDFDQYTHSIVIDERPNTRHHGCAFIATAASSTETDTGIDFDDVSVIDYMAVEVGTAISGGTTPLLNVGILSTGTNGDADGFMASVPLATAGFMTPYRSGANHASYSCTSSEQAGIINVGYAGTWLAHMYAGTGDTESLAPESLFVPSSLTLHATWENSLTYTFPTSHASTGFGLIHFWFTRIR